MYCKDCHIINELSPNYIKDYVGYYCNFKKDESRYTRGIMYIDFDDTPFFPYKSNPTERTILNYFDKKNRINLDFFNKKINKHCLF